MSDYAKFAAMLVVAVIFVGGLFAICNSKGWK